MCEGYFTSSSGTPYSFSNSETIKVQNYDGISIVKNTYEIYYFTRFIATVFTIDLV